MRVRMTRRFAVVVRRDGGRHRFTVPRHYRIYVDGNDYVIGCHLTRCEAWRQPKENISTLDTEEVETWLT